MKKFNTLFLLLSASLVLSGCNNQSASGSSSSTSTSTPAGEDWSDEVKALMNTYCGEVLPYPEDMLTGSLTVKEATSSSSGAKFLQISDEATSYGLKQYYLDLEASSWEGIRDYNGNINQEDSSGTPYSEFVKTSSDGKTGYRVICFFNAATAATSTSAATPACNVIQCFNTLESELNSASDWTDEDKETFKTEITTVLPFAKFGADYEVNSYSSYPDMVIVQDTLAKSLVDEYVALLKDDGFVVNEMYSKTYGYAVMQKTLASGHKLAAYVLYNSGNVVEVDFKATFSESTTWPTELLADVATKTGITVPAPTDTSITGYEYYRKNDTFVIYALTSSAEAALSSYNAQLEALDVTGSKGSYKNFNETFSAETDKLVNSNNEYVGFAIEVEITKPTSTFATEWPATEIQRFLSKFQVSVAAPTPSTLPYKLKYSANDDLQGEYEYWYYYLPLLAEHGYISIDVSTEEKLQYWAEIYALAYMEFTVSFLDSDATIINAYLKQIKNLAWSDQSTRSMMVYEDPKGKLAIGFSYEKGVSTITYMLGSGEEHTPTFGFSEESIDVVIGESKSLPIIVDMYPNSTISYASSDENIVIVSNEGVVTVSSSATAGQSATITATLTDSSGDTHTATITVTAAELTYTAASAIDAVAAKITSKYSQTISATHNSYGDYIMLNFGTNTVDNAKLVVTSAFIPTGFTVVGDGTWSTDENGTQTIEYTFGNVTLSFSVYQNASGNTILLAQATETSASAS